MCIKATRRANRAFTLSEVLLSMAVGGIVIVALMSFTLYAGKSFAALTNYVDLEQRSQHAIDTMTREIRQVNSLQSYTTMTLNGKLITNSVTFQDSDGQPLTYAFQNELLIRTKGGVSSVLLTNCDYLTFLVFKRVPNTTTPNWDAWPMGSAPHQAKLVSVSWICSRSVLGSKINTESVQTANVVMRKERNE